jgi:hypothetical protein
MESWYGDADLDGGIGPLSAASRIGSMIERRLEETGEEK